MKVSANLSERAIRAQIKRDELAIARIKERLSVLYDRLEEMTDSAPYNNFAQRTIGNVVLVAKIINSGDSEKDENLWIFECEDAVDEE
jgi:hypothetical protein